MVQIERNQLLKIDKLYCFRGKINPAQVEEVGKELEQAVAMSGAQRVGNPITATFSVEESLIDVEILLPVDKKIADTEKFCYKDKLKIVNAVRARYTGNPAGLQQTCEELNRYIVDNRLMPITVGYNVTRSMDAMNIDNTEIDVYVGLSPNIL